MEEQKNGDVSGQEKEESMADLLGPETNIEEGKIIKVKVVGKNEDGIAVDLGLKAEGLIAKEEFSTPKQLEEIKAGDEISVYVIRLHSESGHPIVSYKKAKEIVAWDKLSKANKDGFPVEGVIARQIKGGYIVDIGVDAFLPASQLDVYRVKDPAKYLGIKMKFLITEFNSSENNIVISRRRLVEMEQSEAKKKVLGSVKEGDIVDGVVVRLTEFGAFVDIGGMEGLLHIGDIAWHRLGKVEDALQTRQSIKVKILKIENGKISLGLKQLSERPWEKAAMKYHIGNALKCKVVSVTDFGVFAELEPGVEGLLHQSEVSWQDQRSGVLKNYKLGQEIEVKIIAIDPKEEKISLSVKRLKPSPWQEAKKKYKPGTRLKGKVANLTPFGAFVKLEDGLEGLVHVGELSWTKKINHPQEVLKTGQDIEVVLLDIDENKEKVSLSYRATLENPFARYEAGKIVTGKVKRIMDFGAFVELEPGLEALVRIPEISSKKVAHPSEALKVGQEVEAKVLKCDLRERKIDISIKKLENEREKELIKKYVNKDNRPTLGDLLEER